MIFVADELLEKQIRSQKLSPSQNFSLLNRLLEHPYLLKSSTNIIEAPVLQLKAVSDGNGQGCTPLFQGDCASKHCVYVFQREYACVTPSRVELVGTDGATTCIGLAIRNPDSGLTSVGHFDSRKYVTQGMREMVASVHPCDENLLQVHLVGGYVDTTDTHKTATRPGVLKSDQGLACEGYSKPLALKLVKVLHRSVFKFDIKTMCILQHNTAIGSSGHPCPLVRGFTIQTRTGHILPAKFDVEARGPDEVVRGLRLLIANSDEKDGLQASYDTHLDRYVIAPYKWNKNWKFYASAVLGMSDNEILANFSTSPYAESLEFSAEIRRLFTYLYQHPDWKQMFPHGKPRIFTRSIGGAWVLHFCGDKNDSVLF